MSNDDTMRRLEDIAKARRADLDQAREAVIRAAKNWAECDPGALALETPRLMYAVYVLQKLEMLYA